MKFACLPLNVIVEILTPVVARLLPEEHGAGKIQINTKVVKDTYDVGLSMLQLSVDLVVKRDETHRPTLRRLVEAEDYSENQTMSSSSLEVYDPEEETTYLKSRLIIHNFHLAVTEYLKKSR